MPKKELLELKGLEIVSFKTSSHLNGGFDKSDLTSYSSTKDYYANCTGPGCETKLIRTECIHAN